MRYRKKNWSEDTLADAISKGYLIEHPEEYQGNWKQLLGCETLHVEVGAGKGDYFMGMTSLYPNVGWVSIERVRDIAAYAMRKLLANPVTNGKFINADASIIDQWFAQGEIDAIHLNFSDPWPKRSHHKRRLTTPTFINVYHRLLKESGQIILKSDNKDFFEDAVLVITNHAFELIDFWVDFRREDHPEDVITEYEERFISMGQPIYRAIWRKKNV